MKTLIKNGLIVSFIHEGFHAVKVSEADILIEDGSILEVRRDIHEAAETIDATGKMILPGMVNVGANLTAAKLLNGLLPDQHRLTWQGSLYYRLVVPMMAIAADVLSEDEKYNMVRWAMQDAIASGSTAIAEMTFPGFEQATLTAAEALGVCLWLVKQSATGGYPALDQEGKIIHLPSRRTDLEVLTPRSELIRVLDGLHSVESTSDELWQHARQYAQSQPLMLNAAHNALEKQWSWQTHGKSPIALIHEHGALTENTVLINAFDTDFYDRERIRTARAKVSLSALTAIHDAHEFPIVTLLKQDINASLGTGCYGVSMLEEMRAAAYAAKLQTGLAHQFQAADAFYAATVAGGKALNAPLGQLEKGFAADMLIVDPSTLGPISYPVAHLIYTLQPQHVEMALAAGKVIYTNDQQQKERSRKLAAAAQGSAEKVWKEARKSIM